VLRRSARGEPLSCDTAAKVAFLSDPAAYPQHPAHVEVIETHFAWVFLAGTRAYKMKKPTHRQGADWSTTEARERACREELQLNRHLAAQTYLGVEPLVVTPTDLRIGGAGNAVDWLVVMRRLDERRMLRQVLAAHALTPGDLDGVLTFLVEFYRSRQPLPIPGNTYVRRLSARVDVALAALRRWEARLPAAEIDPLADELRAALQSLRAQLAERTEGGRIIEAHGDLRAEHVCLGPPVQIIDALEVYADLRRLDTAEEVAMLALDCEQPSAPWAPGYLRDRYRIIAADPCSDELFELYIAVRALTQAMLAIWHLDDPEQFPDPLPWQKRARAAANAALRHCRSARRNAY
jgi:aminoglycoside phosphotransferase family enzyme